MENEPSEMLAKSREAQKIWSEVSVRDRIACLKHFKQLVMRRMDDIVEAIQRETFKPSLEAVGIEVGAVLLTVAHYSTVAPRLLRAQKIKPHWLFINKSVSVRRAPFGVVGILGPSNLPFSLTIGDAIPALLAGNAVILKPSEMTPLAAEVGVELLKESGLPAGLIQVVTGDSKVGEKIIDEVDFVFFTGSTRAGRAVGEHCARLFKPCVLELGGNAPMIVMEDADLKRAVRAAVWGRFANSGQHCIATERVFVAKKVSAEFKKLLLQELKKIEGADIGRLYVPGTQERCSAQIEEALQNGAQIFFDGRKNGTGPVVLTDCHSKMKVMQEESFGPLLPIATFEQLEEVMQEANGVESGLSASIFSRDQKLARQIASRLEVGNVSINDVMTQFMVMGAPFAGWKSSGLGQRHGDQGLLQFTRPQTILSQRFSLPFFSSRDPWWFPYKKIWEQILRVLLRFV